VTFNMGGKFDKSFNEVAYLGMDRWKKEAGKPQLEFEISNVAQREQAMRRMAEKGGFLVGMLAAMASKSGKVGFVGGMDIPLIRKFQCGFGLSPRPSNKN